MKPLFNRLTLFTQHVWGKSDEVTIILFDPHAPNPLQVLAYNKPSKAVQAFEAQYGVEAIARTDYLWSDVQADCKLA